MAAPACRATSRPSMIMAAATMAAAAGPIRGCPIRCSSIIQSVRSSSIITSTRARPIAAPALSRLIRPIRKARYPAGMPIVIARIIMAIASARCAATTDRRRDPRNWRPFASCERALLLSHLAHQPEPGGADIERQHRGIRDVEAFDLAGHIEPRHHAAGLARQLPQALALRAQHQRQGLPQGNCAEILAALAVEPDRHETLVVQPGERARQILHRD